MFEQCCHLLVSHSDIGGNTGLGAIVNNNKSWKVALDEYDMLPEWPYKYY